MINLVNAFPMVGVDPLLVTTRRLGAAQEWLERPDSVHVLAVSKVRRAIWPLRRLISRVSPDIVFSTMVDANIVTAIATLNANCPIVLRETNSHRARADLGPIRHRLAGRAYRRANAVVALSRGVANELREDFDIDDRKIETIGNPVRVENLSRQAACVRKAARDSTKDRRQIVAIGRLTRQKGFDLLLNAFAALRTEDVQLTILGDGPDRAALEQQVRKLRIEDRVTMPGFVHSTMDWLAGADVFVLSSRWEGFGHVLVEAMAAKVPVISTDCPHGPTDIINHAHTGILVPLGEGLVDRLRDQIDGLLSSPEYADRLRGAAASAANRFECEAVASKYAKLFGRLISAA